LYWFNQSAFGLSEEFSLVGIVIGLAIYNGVILDLRLPLVVYKQLCKEPCFTLKDLEESHPEEARGLQALLDYEDDDMEDVFCLDFQVQYEYFGAIRTFDLLPGGEKIPVTQENKQKYVDCYIRYILLDSVKEQIGAFSQGFNMVAGPTVTIFRAEELSLMVIGSQKVDIEELIKSTTYKGSFHASHKVVKWFWAMVRSWDEEYQKMLLTFATGSDRVPIKGLSHLSFVVQSGGYDTSKLPTSATCFNTLIFPSYSSKHQLAEKFKLAIENASGFGLK